MAVGASDARKFGTTFTLKPNSMDRKSIFHLMHHSINIINFNLTHRLEHKFQNVLNG